MTNSYTQSRSTLATIRQENRRNAGQLVILPAAHQGLESAMFCGPCQRWSPHCAVARCRRDQDPTADATRHTRVGALPAAPAELEAAA